MSTELENVNRELHLQQTVAVFEHRLANNSTIREACEACDVKERSFYRWVNDGILEDYLGECRKSRASASAAMAAEAVPDIMRYMISIASGQETVRGANPIAAAQFVFGAAGVKAALPDARPKDQMVPTILAFMPQFATFKVEHGSPVTEDGCLIIEGEAVVLEDSDGDGQHSQHQPGDGRGGGAVVVQEKGTNTA